MPVLWAEEFQRSYPPWKKFQVNQIFSLYIQIFVSPLFIAKYGRAKGFDAPENKIRGDWALAFKGVYYRLHVERLFIVLGCEFYVLWSLRISSFDRGIYTKNSYISKTTWWYIYVTLWGVENWTPRLYTNLLVSPVGWTYPHSACNSTFKGANWLSI